MTYRISSLKEVMGHFRAMDPKYDNLHGRLFSFVVPDSGRFETYLNELNLPAAALPDAHPAVVLFGQMAGLIQHQLNQFIVSDGKSLQMQIQVRDIQLPAAAYVAIVSPAERNGSSVSYQRARSSIAFARALISASYGRLPFYNRLADFDLDSSGGLHLLGREMRMPMYADFFKIDDASIVNEIAERLALQSRPYRQRLARACEFIDTALEQADEAFRFSAYWIALEIITGKSGAIRAALAQAYGWRDVRLVDEKLLFSEIKGIRHQLMHKGLFGTMPSYVERLLQLYFWDIVFNQVELKPRGLSLALAESGMIEEEKMHG